MPKTTKVEEANPWFWIKEAKEGIERRLNEPQHHHSARNVIFFLGDGMSVPTLTAARTLLGQRRGDTGEEAQLSFEQFPTVGLAKVIVVLAERSLLERKHSIRSFD